MCVLLMEVCMNFDYIRMLSYAEVTQFITKALSAYFKTNLFVKPGNIKINTVSQQVEFEAVLSNGKYVTGKAVCTNFDCEITINAKTQTTLAYTNEWAQWVYDMLKSKDISEYSRVGEIYKADYNDHCAKVRDDKSAKAEQEFETSLLK